MPRYRSNLDTGSKIFLLVSAPVTAFGAIGAGAYQALYNYPTSFNDVSEAALIGGVAGAATGVMLGLGAVFAKEIYDSAAEGISRLRHKRQLARKRIQAHSDLEELLYSSDEPFRDSRKENSNSYPDLRRNRLY